MTELLSKVLFPINLIYLINNYLSHNLDALYGDRHFLNFSSHNKTTFFALRTHIISLLNSDISLRFLKRRTCESPFDSSSLLQLKQLIKLVFLAPPQDSNCKRKR